jgi:hypothetical protein
LVTIVLTLVTLTFQIDGGLDLGLGRIVRDLEHDSVKLRQHRRFLGDVRGQDDVVMAIVDRRVGRLLSH